MSTIKSLICVTVNENNHEPAPNFDIVCLHLLERTDRVCEMTKTLRVRPLLIENR